MCSPLPVEWFKKTLSAKVDSSWIESEGKHGHHRMCTDANGKKVVHCMKIEEAMTRSEKSKIIKPKGHWFGRLHRLRFNLYSNDLDLIKKPDLVTFSCPFSQPGRGANSLQNAFGLKDDRDMFNDIRVSPFSVDDYTFLIVFYCRVHVINCVPNILKQAWDCHSLGRVSHPARSQL